jgi:hypothetical protein
VLRVRARAFATNPIVGTTIAFVAGVAIRTNYTFRVQPPQRYVYSDMGLYVELARRLATSSEPLAPWDVTHPIGYPAVLAALYSWDPSLNRAAHVQLLVSCLVPLATGLLGLATFGRRTAFACVIFSSFYFPFIDFGALFLAEIYFIFWLAISFAGLFAAMRVQTRTPMILLSLGSGLALSLASALKSVALPAVACFFLANVFGKLLTRTSSTPVGVLQAGTSLRRLKGVALRGSITAVAASPLLIVLATICTRANRGHMCVTGNKVGADFLLGHYGRIGSMGWGADLGRAFQFGSPGSYLRHYDNVARVAFPMTDSVANAAEASRWVFAHPFEAIVVSLDHIYDAFFGVAAWPTYATSQWPFAHLAQYVFLIFLFIPTVLVCADLMRLGARHVLSSQTALVLAPVTALAITVAIATGEVRYRIPFDLFFIVVACALATGDFRRVDGSFSQAPDKATEKDN